MNKLVAEYKIVDGEITIFDSGKYKIPLYQRAFAWKEKQIVQLIEDIDGIGNNTNYYLGTLIVSRQNDYFEVVDGQQRLTTLFILLDYLGFDLPDGCMGFACRDRSNFTLQHMRDIIQDNREKIGFEELEENIIKGGEIIQQELGKRYGDNLTPFRDKLQFVFLYRVEVPKNTDLNHYFEIMNTRGEQLEQSDILKAKLMGYLEKAGDRSVFASVWDACSDMTGYVQMHFNPTLRDYFFGDDWQSMPQKNWCFYQKAMPNSASGKSYKIENLIDPKFCCIDDEELDDDRKVRFESIIDFPYFLLHTLKVYLNRNNVSHKDGKTPIINELLDDKRLVETFDFVLKNGVKGGAKIDEKKFAKCFIMCLLRTRYLFDKYIIKREFVNESIDGEWSLKSLKSSKKKPYYTNSRLVCPGQWGTTNDMICKELLMLQSALRVSYTSPKIMHWITDMLIWLVKASKNINDEISNLYGYVEGIAQDVVKNQFFDVDSFNELGVNTPHIVFNYLDFVLWRKDKLKYADFAFEFRNSVEHWYPRNPSEGTFEKWDNGLDRFGNLCIIQRNVNSRFSNMSPEAKKTTFQKMIAKGSIKLRIMSELTTSKGMINASKLWKRTIFEQHEKEMLDILRDACGMP